MGITADHRQVPCIADHPIIHPQLKVTPAEIKEKFHARLFQACLTGNSFILGVKVNFP